MADSRRTKDMQQSQERLDAASQQDVRDLAAPPPISAHDTGTAEVIEPKAAEREITGSDPVDAAAMTTEPRAEVSETADLFQAGPAQPMTTGPIAAGQISTRPDKFQLETRLIELSAALIAVQQLFSHLEHDFYLAAFGRYDE
jgi:hypothetical protein